MAVSAKINGTTYEMDKNYSITQQGGSVATTQIEVSLGVNPVPSIFQTVQIYVGATLIFTGIITSLSTPEYSRGTESKVFSVQASSLEALLSMRIMTASYYSATYPTWADVVNKIFTDYISTEGITLGGISTFATGPDSKYIVTNKKISDVLTEITQTIGNAAWWISPDRKFYFQVATDFTTVSTPSLLSKIKLTESIGDIRSVQTIRGATASVEATATNTTLQAVIAARTGGSGKVENYENDSDIHTDTAAGTVATARLVQYVETEKEITCECHDLTNSGIYLDWNLSLTLGGVTISGHFVVVERMLQHFVNDTFTISVKLKNRNFFVRYGYSIKQTTVLASDVQTTYTDLASDERYTPAEKNSDKIKWTAVLTERTQILADFTTYSITYTDYATKFQALADWLNDGAWTTGDPLFLSAGRITQTEIIVGATYLARWADYYNKRDLAQQAIINARDSVAISTAGTNVATLAPRYLGIGQLAATGTAAFAGYTVSAPVFTGGVLTTNSTTTSIGSVTPHTGDWMVNYDGAVATLGTYLWSGSAWTQTGVTADMRGSGIEDVFRLTCLATPITITEGTTWIEAVIYKMWAKYIKVLTGGSIRGGDRYAEDGTLADGTKSGFFLGATGSCKVAGITFEGSQGGGVQWGASYQVGNPKSVVTIGDPTICAITEKNVVVMDNGADTMTMYEWNGIEYSAVGTPLSVAHGSCSMVAINHDSFVLADNASQTLRTIHWDGASFSQVGSAVSITTNGETSLAALSETSVVLYQKDSVYAMQNYTWGGSAWVAVGTPKTFPTYTPASIASLNSTDIAFYGGYGSLAGSLEVYRLSAGVFTKIGNTLSLGGSGSIGALNGTDVITISTTGVISCSRFDGADWAIIQGITKSIYSGFQSLSTISGTDFAIADGYTNELRRMRLSFAMSKKWGYPFIP